MKVRGEIIWESQIADGDYMACCHLHFHEWNIIPTDSCGYDGVGLRHYQLGAADEFSGIVVVHEQLLLQGPSESLGSTKRHTRKEHNKSTRIW